MKIRNVVTAAMLSGMLFAVPAVAQNPNGDFSALRGVEAQTLSAEEMQAITGQLNAYDIAAALEAAAAKLDKFPRLQAATLKLAEFYATNAEQINALYYKLGVLTPCQTCQ
jgi:hypothetical protein